MHCGQGVFAGADGPQCREGREPLRCLFVHSEPRRCVQCQKQSREKRSKDCLSSCRLLVFEVFYSLKCLILMKTTQI